MPGARSSIIRPGPRLGLRLDFNTAYFSPNAGALTLGGFGPGVTIAPPVSPYFTPDFYIGPAGGTGSGGIGDPWSLSYALAGAGGAITPGKQIAVRAGTYAGTFTSTVNGTALAPIVFRQYPGEHATFTPNSTSTTLTMNGSYTWVQGVEIVAPNFRNVGCVSLSGTENRLINAVVHDALGDCVSMFNSAVGGQTYGCIMYNAGPNWPADNDFNGYFMYLNNTTGTKVIMDNVCFNSTTYGFHAYSSGIANTMNNLHYTGNVVFNNGLHNTAAVFATMGTPDSTGIVLASNMSYGTPIAGKWAGPNNPFFVDQGQSLQVTNNYLVGVLCITRQNVATVTGNTVVAAGAGVAGDTVNILGPVTGWTWDNNRYYRDAAATAWRFNGTDFTFANWKAATGLGGSDVVVGSTPASTVVFIRLNQYETGRANIIIYNWTNASTVAVDLSTVLVVGQAYTVVNAQDFYGTPVASGIYTGGAVNLPMAGISPPAPLYGQSFLPGPVTGPTFQVFVVRLQGA